MKYLTLLVIMIALLINATSGFAVTNELQTQQDCPERLGQPEAAFSPDGKYLAATTRESESMVVHIWDVTSRKELRSIEPKAENVWIGSLAFSPDDKYVVLGNRSDKETIAELWEISAGKHLRSFVYPFINNSHFRVAFSQGGQSLLTSDAGGAELWETQTGKLLHRLNFSDGADQVVMSPDAQYLIQVGETSVIWDVAGEKKILTIGPSDEFAPWDAESSPDNKFLLLVSPGRYALWNTSTKQAEHLALDETDEFAHISHDGKLLVLGSGSRFKPLSVWDMTTRKKIMSYVPDEFWNAEFSLDNKQLYIVELTDAAYIYKARVIEIATGKELNNFELSRIPDSVNRTWFSPAGEYMFTSHSNYIFKLWHFPDGASWCL